MYNFTSMVGTCLVSEDASVVKKEEDQFEFSCQKISDTLANVSGYAVKWGRGWQLALKCAEIHWFIQTDKWADYSFFSLTDTVDIKFPHLFCYQNLSRYNQRFCLVLWSQMAFRLYFPPPCEVPQQVGCQIFLSSPPTPLGNGEKENLEQWTYDKTARDPLIRSETKLSVKWGCAMEFILYFPASGKCSAGIQCFSIFLYSHMFTQLFHGNAVKKSWVTLDFCILARKWQT